VIEPQFSKWRKSTRSSGGGNCVEVALADGLPLVGVRDTKNRDGGTLAFSSDDWHDFIAGVRAGKFNLG
jgi:hypothetical protein